MNSILQLRRGLALSTKLGSLRRPTCMDFLQRLSAFFGREKVKKKSLYMTNNQIRFLWRSLFYTVTKSAEAEQKWGKGKETISQKRSKAGMCTHQSHAPYQSITYLNNSMQLKCSWDDNWLTKTLYVTNSVPSVNCNCNWNRKITAK